MPGGATSGKMCRNQPTRVWEEEGQGPRQRPWRHEAGWEPVSDNYILQDLEETINICPLTTLEMDEWLWDPVCKMGIPIGRPWLWWQMR